jgi:RNA polymerase sigma-70 factor, ECF subfamily
MTVEPELIENARRNPAALDPLIAAVWPEAYRTAVAILRDHGLAQDAAQESCAAIARSLPSLRDSAALPAWSYKIVVSHALMAARRRAPIRSLDAATQQSFTFDRSDALDLYDALASLTPFQRAVILLHYYAGLRSAEIASATRVPASTIRFHLMRARRALRKTLAATTKSHARHEVLTDVR